MEEYIISPHADSMRRRNWYSSYPFFVTSFKYICNFSLVFRMVEAEEEYVEQLEVELVTGLFSTVFS